ncbi:MAG: hypothetical protein M1827_004746 [Pycnora praestabilis]|nr:MAG: hypothetical protein M1827_004746 [Pycnora praestabilis]
MSSSHPPYKDETAGDEGEDDEDVMLDSAEAEEVIPEDEDQPMDSDPEDEPGETIQEIQLQNDSIAHFDGHKDSIFCIAQHPIHPNIVATGGGDDMGYIFDSTPADSPVLPASYLSAPQPTERESIAPLATLDGHTDSVNAITFTLPKGDYVFSAGLDGQLRAYQDASRGNGRTWRLLAEVQEVEEINWLIPCPDPDFPNTIALGANDGSVWVYTIDAKDTGSPLTIVQAFYLHTESCTAGAWTPDGKMLATVSEDGSLYVWDVFGAASAAGLAGAEGGQYVVGLTALDQRFAIEGGLFSVAVTPKGTYVVVGGAGGAARVIGLPRIGSANQSVTTGAKGAGSASKAGGGRRAGGSTGGSSKTSSGQAGQILASLQAQTDGIETLSFSPSGALLAAGSVDGSIAIFNTEQANFSVRRYIRGAHEDFAVVKVEFVKSAKADGWLLTSAGMDGVVRRWDLKGDSRDSKPPEEWRGHRGDGEGGGVLGFVQGGDGGRIITAGDE